MFCDRWPRVYRRGDQGTPPPPPNEMTQGLQDPRTRRGGCTTTAGTDPAATWLPDRANQCPAQKKRPAETSH